MMWLGFIRDKFTPTNGIMFNTVCTITIMPETVIFFSLSQWNCYSRTLILSANSKVTNSPSTLLLEYIEIIPDIQSLPVELNATFNIIIITTLLLQQQNSFTYLQNEFTYFCYSLPLKFSFWKNLTVIIDQCIR